MDIRGAVPRPGSVLAARVVGRDVELDALHNAWARAVDGDGGVLFLAGEPGIGKSRLTHVIAETVEGRATPVLRGRAVPTLTPLPFRPLAEALCSAVRRGVVQDHPDLAPFTSILGLLVPEWRERDAPVVEPVMALAEGILRLLRVVGDGRGCLLVLEDLHWADLETLQILEYLADNLASERVLCVVTLRDEVASAGLDLALALRARRASTLVTLSRLEPHDVAEMVRSCLDASAVPDAALDLAGRAEGVPFLVEELLAAAISSGALVADGRSWSAPGTVEPIVPMAFSDDMRRRLAALGECTRDVLRAAAVLGRRFDWSLLAPITGLSHEEVLVALRDAVDAQIVAVDPAEPTYRFRHALSRDAVVTNLLPQEVVDLSHRALGAVEAAHPDLEDDWCELAARLAEGAGDARRAGRLLLVAGERALERGALTSAEATLDRARELLQADDPTRLDVDECLSEVLALAGKRDRAVGIGDALLARLGDDPGAAHRRAEIYLRLARAELAATRSDEAHEFLERARSEIAVAPEETLVARVDAVHAQAAILRDPDQAPALARAALASAERLGLPEVMCEALEILGRSQRRHDLQAAEDAFARALALAETHGLPLWRTRALHELGTVDLLRGGPVTRLEEARQLAVAQGALATAAVIDVQIAAALAVGDDPEPGALAARRSAELAGRYRLGHTLAAAAALEAHVHARAGRHAEMQRCTETARAHAAGVPDVEVKLAFAAAVLAFLEEDRAAVRGHLSKAVLDAASGPGGDYSAAPFAGMLALVRVLDGPADEAPGIEFAEKSVHFLACAFLRYTQGVVAGRAGESDRAAALIHEGDRTLGDHQWLRQLGHRLVAEAAVADGWGQPVPWLREALAFFDARGEDRIASACRSLLRGTGAAVPRRRGEAVPAPFGALGVTSRELEVLRLLALGLANKEIGARLYISPRTVERHIASLSDKTGVGRRSELVAYAARTLSEMPST